MRHARNIQDTASKLFWLFAVVLAATFAHYPVGATGAKPSDKPSAAHPATPPKPVEIDLDHAPEVALPEIGRDLKPYEFKTSDGKAGWVVRIPGARPIATPAYADGMIFVGGGYGGNAFYAFNASTGEMAWKFNTHDDGPTAAVVAEGKVAFNTESCTVYVLDEKTGKLVWQKWLGDPLMSQPAIDRGKLYMAYPATSGSRAGTHRLAAFELNTGKKLWEQDITGDVISAPVIAKDTVYVTCFDGTSFAMDSISGKVLWSKRESATSAPAVANGAVMVSRKVTKGKEVREGLIPMKAEDGKDNSSALLTEDKAQYLTADNAGSALSTSAITMLDSSVGFSAAPPSAELQSAKENVGVKTVVGGWAYQGSRAAYQGGQWMNAQGRYVNAIGESSGQANWRAEARGKGVGDNLQVFSPPALGREYMYLDSATGNIVAVRQKDGQVGFNYRFSQPMVFQPALAEGNVYAGTSQGLLICLKTGGRDADGWYAWGGNAQHNK